MNDRSPREAFLAGERTDDVVLYLAESAVDALETLARVGERVEGSDGDEASEGGADGEGGDDADGGGEPGVVIVADGERGRNAFRSATGVDAMAFAQEAMEIEGLVDSDLTGGTCPDTPEGGDHGTRFIFAFAEAQNEAVGGIYAEGDVIHAYAQCACGVAYSDRWVVES